MPQFASKTALYLGIAACGLGLIVFLGLGAFVFGVSDVDGGESDAPTPTTAARPVATTTTPTRTAVPTDADRAVNVELTANQPDDSAVATPVIEQLADGAVLRLRVRDLRPGARGSVQQCVRVAGGVESCRNRFPVQVGDDGSAYFQYEVVRGSQPCDAMASCVVTVTDDDNRWAVAYTIFGERVPLPAAVRVQPRGPYRVGATVHVEVEPVAPGTRLSVAFCAPACGSATVATGAGDGVATADIVLRSRCDRGERCSIKVGGLATRDAVTSVNFIAGPTASYDAARLLLGIIGAVAFLLAARMLVRRTDWRAPTEAATPDLDRATL